MQEGKIEAIGFELEPDEKEKAKSLIENHAEKLAKRCNFDKLKIELKKSAHGKAFLHEINVNLRIGKATLVSDSADYNLYRAISTSLKKITSASAHKDKK